MLLVWLSVTGKVLFWYSKQARWNHMQWEPGYRSVLISWHEIVDSQIQSAAKNKLVLILISCITRNHSFYGLFWYQIFAIYTRKYGNYDRFIRQLAIYFPIPLNWYLLQSRNKSYRSVIVLQKYMYFSRMNLRSQPLKPLIFLVHTGVKPNQIKLIGTLNHPISPNHHCTTCWTGTPNSFLQLSNIIMTLLAYTGLY